MPSDQAIRDQVRRLLEGVSDLEVRELCIAALRRAYNAKRLPPQFQMHGHLGRELLPMLAERRSIDLKGQANNLSEAFLDALSEPGMSGVFDFIAWFVRVGLAWPLGAQPNQTPISLQLTHAGIRFLERDEDHPLLPGFLARVVQRCPGLPDPVVGMLMQGASCLDHGLTQPAISLMGVAYETAVEEVVSALVKKNVLPAAVEGMSAARRIREVEQEIDAVMQSTTKQQTDDRYAVHRAYDFADQLRRRRNDASHTTPKFEDRQEAEELLVSAGRHLPNLWRMAL
jgi:hypothetical protein